jgi:DNA-binding NarL/FixJ family response regulator
MDEAACLLAVHCVARKQEPGDFSAMIAIGDDVVARVVKRARGMIENCEASASPVHLTQRQQAVLEAITSGLSNKEIAAQLNFSLRSVKFYVSALLLKFEVSTRARLTCKLASLAPLQPEIPFPLPTGREHRPVGKQEEPRRNTPLMIPVQARLQGKNSRR